MESNIFKSQVFHLFISNPTVENAKILKHFINAQTYAICFAGKENLVLTALFTVIGDMNVRNKDDIICNLIDAANNLISNSKLKTVISVHTMLVILLKHIGLCPSYMLTQTMNTPPEELQLATINCFEIIFLKITSEVVEKIYIKENLNLLAQVLSISENILANGVCGPLRIAAVKCIMSLFQVHDATDERNTKQRQYIADVVFVLIPKIVRTLTNIAVGSNTLSETLKMYSIIALARILCLIFEDEVVEPSSNENMKYLVETSWVGKSSNLQSSNTFENSGTKNSFGINNTISTIPHEIS
ncbi:uncharacterized protein LOC129571804 [Sitodiplosis mosellana]|uniref:uncharacterized protein LOC129571804 n=1 Tax=Sitodiplosis mosellana TaxID=263140 RepID=UPI0024441943|nr:uncharacterized protein LOC129571804 [Sitodiplosis mosellana]